ncbi:MAG: response regulator [Alphaproteobacteria bacterium]|nr:response regulator [Alphaproteobacteria bacterium]
MGNVMVQKREKAKEKVPTFSFSENKEPLFLLLVEDDKSDAFLARRTVYNTTKKTSRYEYYIDHALSLEEALEALGTGKYSAVLLDLSLVDADNLEGVDAIKENFPEVPIIVLTNNEDRNTKLDATVKGIHAYLYKRHLENNPELVADAIDRAIMTVNQ